MNKENIVLIIGSGGKEKFQFLIELTKLNKKVVVMDLSDNKNLKYPKNITTIFLPKLDKKTVKKGVDTLLLNFNIEAPGSILESALETTAYIRDYLKLSGFSLEKTMIARDKTLMSKMLQDNEIRTPQFQSFSKNDNAKHILSLASKFEYPIILKPTMGSSNVGLRYIKSPNSFWKYYQDALLEVKESPFKKYEASKWLDGWILNEYIDGKEVEVDLYIKKGKIAFKIVQEKTLIFKHGEFIDENNAVIPTITLTDKEKKDLDIELNKLAKTVWNNMAKPCNVNYFNIYAEYIIDKKSKSFCIEFALRTGGALLPKSVYMSTGVSTFEIVAKSLLNQPTEIPKKISNKGVCWQIIFSNYSGIYRGMEGIDKINNNITIIPAKKEGEKIIVPQADYLCYILTEGETSIEASNKLAKALSNAYVLTENSEGKIEKSKIPTTPLF